MKIVVNATAAKLGGAKTIVSSFLSWAAENDRENTYYVFSGFEGDSYKNINFIYFPTTGFFSFLATTFFSLIAVFLRADVLVSFSNFNSFFSFGIKRITYFHQLKVFNDASFKFALTRFLIKLQKNVDYVCQSIGVKEQLKSLVGKKSSISVAWPGVYVPVIKNNVGGEAENISDGFSVCPISDVRSDHKGFSDLFACYSQLKENGYKILVTSEPHGYHDNDVFEFVGPVAQSELFKLYMKADAVFFPSKYETVGLPIFEALYFGCKVFVRKTEYIDCLSSRFELDKSLSYWPVSSGKYYEPIELPGNKDWCNPEWWVVVGLY